MADYTVVVGYVGNSQGLKHVGETPVLNFSVASSNYAGKKGNVTTWYSIEYWGKSAEGVAPFVEKGTMVMVRGILVPDEGGNPPTYQDRDGNTRSNFRLRADSVQLMGGKNRNEAEAEAEPIVEDDDMPF